jgi:site-specific DNA-methyltransferase (adenine-specific)
MKEMPENSVDSIVTDPPYELGFMGKSWDSSGIAFNIEVWQEALRVLKPGGHLIAFSGSRTYHRMAVAIEDAGFEIRDQIMYVYGSGFPKSHNISKAIDKAAGAEREVVGTKIANPKGIKVAEQRTDIGAGSFGGEAKEIDITAPATEAAKQWDGWGTALKPAHEPMVLARKPLIGTVADNVLTHGTGGLNIDGSRVEGEVPSVPMAEWTRSGTTGSSDKRNGEMSQPHSQGRWPANFIHDGSDEVLALFPDTKATGSGRVSGFRKGGASENAVGLAGKKNAADGFSDSGSAARFFYCAKASKRDRNEGLEGFEGKEIGAKGNGLARKCATCSASVIDGCACPNRTFVNPSRANHHPTVKPTTLMQYLVRLVTPPNGTVLDPFMGSGSTGKACAYEGFDFIGIEQSAEYVEIARARIEYVNTAIITPA